MTTCIVQVPYLGVELVNKHLRFGTAIGWDRLVFIAGVHRREVHFGITGAADFRTYSTFQVSAF